VNSITRIGVAAGVTSGLISSLVRVALFLMFGDMYRYPNFSLSVIQACFDILFIVTISTVLGYSYGEVARRHEQKYQDAYVVPKKTYVMIAVVAVVLLVILVRLSSFVDLPIEVGLVRTFTPMVFFPIFYAIFALRNRLFGG
jgi:hypothetical protein